MLKMHIYMFYCFGAQDLQKNCTGLVLNPAKKNHCLCPFPLKCLQSSLQTKAILELKWEIYSTSSIAGGSC